MIGRDGVVKWGKVDYKQMKGFRKKLQGLGDEQEAFCRAAAKELAARLLAKVIRRTPVGVYPAGSGMTGGMLQRGWTGDTDAGATYAKSLPIRKQGDAYVVDIINPTDYASYVEYGHRTRGGGGWVKGKFMLTISTDEIKRSAPKILEKKLEKWLVEALNGK